MTEAPTRLLPGGVDLATGEIRDGGYKPCTECGSTSGDCRCFDDEPGSTEPCAWCKGPPGKCRCLV